MLSKSKLQEQAMGNWFFYFETNICLIAKTYIADRNRVVMEKSVSFIFFKINSWTKNAGDGAGRIVHKKNVNKQFAVPKGEGIRVNLVI